MRLPVELQQGVEDRTIERELILARSRSESSHRACRAALRVARMAGLTWP